MCFACWITKTTDTHSEYVIFVAFPWQICYLNSPQCGIYMYITCLVYICTHLTTTYNDICLYPLVNEERTVTRRTHSAYFYYAYVTGPADHCYYYHPSIILFCGQLITLIWLLPMYICQIPLQTFGTITTIVKADLHTILFMIYYLDS
jgi:hypothetical protein